MELNMNSVGIPRGFQGNAGGFGRFGASKGFAHIAT